MSTTAVANQIIEKQDNEGMLRRAMERMIQLYTDKAHFVYELLQNAEDAGATNIRFQQYEDKLVVSHDGQPFSLENLQSICDIGNSDKVDKLNQIGEFGVGFKSVFGICETVYLYSHPDASRPEHSTFDRYAIQIRNFTHPVDISDKEIGEGYTTQFVFPYSVGHSFSGFTETEKLNRTLSERLQNLGITTLLFMKSLKSIEYEIEIQDVRKTGVYMLEKTAINDHCKFVSAIGETSGDEDAETNSYLVFSRPVKGLQAERSVDIAFEVAIDKNGEYEFIPTSFPFAFVFFPTETESKLKFIIQAPFRTTPNRSSIPADDDGNRRLSDLTADLLYDSVLELRDEGKLNYSLLNILPFDEDDFINAPLFGDFYSYTNDLMESEDVLLCADGSYASRDSVKIARGEKLAQLLTDELLTELLDDDIEYHWLPSFLTETREKYKKLYNYLTGKLRIEVIRPEELRNAFNDNPEFFNNRDDKWLIKLYKLYERVGAAFSKEKGTANMLTARFIKTAASTFEAPYRRSDGHEYNYYWNEDDDDVYYLPNIFVPEGDTDDIPDNALVNRDIYKECRHFFNEVLGLSRPDNYELFIGKMRRRYSKEEITVSEKTILSDLKKLLRYRSVDEYRSEIESLIRQNIPLKCNNDGTITYKKIFGGSIHFSVSEDGFSMQDYFKNVREYNYIDEEYYHENGINREHLSEIGVDDRFIEYLDRTKGEYSSSGRGAKPEWRVDDNLRWDLTLYCLKDVLEYIEDNPDDPNSMKKSAIIFSFLKKYEKYLHGYLHVGGKVGDQPDSYADIVRILRKDWHYINTTWRGKWIYTKDLELVSSRNITKMEIQSDLYGDVLADTHIFEYLGFIPCKEDEQLKYQRDYDRMDSEQKNWFFETELKNRYGRSLEDFESLIVLKDTANKRNTIDNEDEDFEFPTVMVRNWDHLRKHAEEILAYASPVQYQEKIRSLRVSRKNNSIDAYLRSMYEVGDHRYACQMCHEPVSSYEKCQLSQSMEKELDPLYLCLCSNCATKYRRLRRNNAHKQGLVRQIAGLTEEEISTHTPVEITVGDESLWFTQIHIAEIRELIGLCSYAEE